MGEGWSEQKGLIPSEGITSHPDPRMHLRVGHGEIDSCPIKDKVRASEVLALHIPHREIQSQPPVEMTPKSNKEGGLLLGVKLVAFILTRLALEIERDTYGEVEHGETKKHYMAIIKSGQRNRVNFLRQISSELMEVTKDL